MKINIPDGDNPTAQQLLAANPDLNSTDMRDLLIEYGTPTRTATELTQPRRDDEQRALAARLGAALTAG